VLRFQSRDVSSREMQWSGQLLVGMLFSLVYLFTNCQQGVTSRRCFALYLDTFFTAVFHSALLLLTFYYFLLISSLIQVVTCHQTALS